MPTLLPIFVEFRRKKCVSTLFSASLSSNMTFGWALQYFFFVIKFSRFFYAPQGLTSAENLCVCYVITVIVYLRKNPKKIPSHNVFTPHSAIPFYNSPPIKKATDFSIALCIYIITQKHMDDKKALSIFALRNISTSVCYHSTHLTNTFPHDK